MTEIPRLDNCGKYLAQDNQGNWHYLNHANTWQGFQGPQIEPRHQEPVNEPAPFAYTTPSIVEGFNDPNTIVGSIWPPHVAAKHGKYATIPLYAAPQPAPVVTVREAVRQYLDQQAAAHEDGHIEKGSYFSTLDNLPDFVAAALQKQEIGA